MSIKKEKLYKMIERLDDTDQKSVYDFMDYLLNRPNKYYWDKISEQDPDDESLSKEEKEVINEKQKDYVPWDDVKNDLGL